MHVCGEGKLHPRFRFTFWRNSKNEQGKPRSEPETAKNAFFHDDECRKLETPRRSLDRTQTVSSCPVWEWSRDLSTLRIGLLRDHTGMKRIFTKHIYPGNYDSKIIIIINLESVQAFFFLT